MTEAEHIGPAWPGERRTVNAEFLHDHVGDMTVPIFYLAGPPGLVVAATKAVLEAGANPAHVLAEEFAGMKARPVTRRRRRDQTAGKAGLHEGRGAVGIRYRVR